MSTRTERLVLERPTAAHADALFAISSDPRVWTHLPSGRHTDVAQTRADIERWQRSWDLIGLGTWTVSLPGGSVIGYGGCSHQGAYWNIGYRLSPEHQGRGYATEVALAGMEHAREADPSLPRVAYLLEHNAASGRVARRLGLELAWRGPDASVPGVRLVYADRPLTPEQLSAVQH
ncbi:GNAT family N-acetyltransferase [Microbacterium indicum]|uniref:GNAT family N-acetyltransferase n=1 Tax=Microbacterium indicum TaxID=358100 RepID=UPI000424BB43|nr:GNAT family N-acetyltransferase [Microbacterium indicum]